MKTTNNQVPSSFKSPLSTTIANVTGSVVGLIGLGSLVNTVNLYNKNVEMYVSQGYPAAEVTKELMPSMLLPGIMEAVALYGGLAFLILYAGSINKKLSQYATSTENSRADVVEAQPLNSPTEETNLLDVDDQGQSVSDD